MDRGSFVFATANKVTSKREPQAMRKVACRSQRQLACLPGVGSLRGLAHNLAAAGVPSVCSVLGRLSTQFIYTHTPHVGIRIA